MAYLEIVKGHRRRKIEVRDEPLSIGRSPECQLVLDDRAVSRRHAVVRRDGDGFVVEDLKSINHTFVNAHEITEGTPLRHRDHLRICHYEFIFHVEDSESSERFGVQIVLREGSDSSARRLSETSTPGTGTPSGSKDARPEQKLPAVQAILRDLSTVVNEDQLLPRILGSLFTIFPQAERGYILFINEDGKTLTPKAMKARHGNDDSLHISRAIVDRVLTNGQPLLLADAPTDPEIGSTESIMCYNIHSIMCVPLASPGNPPIGIVQIHTENRKHKFKSEDLETLVNVATIAAFKLENARMHKELLKQEKLRIEGEYAKTVQTEFLPSACPEIAGYGFDAYYKAAGSVGGDYYDFVPVGNDRLVIALGDVAGKGLAAALLMAHLHGDVRSAAKSCSDPGRALQAVNQAICEAGPAEKFVSLVYMVLNTREHTLDIVNAGHMPPLLRKADGTILQIGEEHSGPLLKFSPEHDYETVRLRLAPGDVVLVYTDGVTDAMNSKQKRFKLDRLCGIFKKAKPNPIDVLDAIVVEVHRFTGDAEQNDDIAMISFGRNSS